MNLEHVMLGLLSLGPRTGYDLKKEIANSRILHWSGNSNQIYRALLQLSEAEMVTVEVVHQDKGPTKKIFSLTALGREKLRAWMTSEVEPPETRNGFLTRLLFAGALEHSETEAMILAYEQVLRVQKMVAVEERERRSGTDPATRAGYLASGIDDYAVRMLETEMDWLRKLRSRMPLD